LGRHDRQARLAEVGSAGQRRIGEATVAVHADGLAAEVATRYLAGAGVGRLRVRDRALAATAIAIDPAVRVEVDETATIATSEEEPSAGFCDPSAREAARGAREALRALRAIVLGGEGAT
jgi:hypothetical protein